MQNVGPNRHPTAIEDADLENQWDQTRDHRFRVDRPIREKPGHQFDPVRSSEKGGERAVDSSNDEWGPLVGAIDGGTVAGGGDPAGKRVEEREGFRERIPKTGNCTSTRSRWSRSCGIEEN